MEVKPGYKMTEVGVIPEDWEALHIDSIADVTSGKRLPLGRMLIDEETPYPYIRVCDMQFGTVSQADIKYVPCDVYPVISRYRIFTSDIFISVAGTLGIVGKVPLELDGANLTENADRITNIKCSQDYLLHVLMSPLVQGAIESLRTVGAQPKLALTRIRKFLIPLPPTKAEQEAIASALSDVDALIESLEQLLAKKRNIKQGAMQELLTGKRRLPGFSGEWIAKRLGDIAALQRGFDLPSSHLQSGKYPVVYSNGILTHHSRFMVKAPGVVTGRSGTIGRVHFLETDFWPHNTSLWVSNFNSNYPLFVYYLLSFVGLDSFLSGSGVPTLNRNDVHAHVVLFPCEVEEQVAISCVLKEMDDELAGVDMKLIKCRHLKQAMMQELLTGRIRLV